MDKKIQFLVLLGGLLFSSPLTAFAQTQNLGNYGTNMSISTIIPNLVQITLWLVFGLVVVVCFVVSGIMFLIAQGDPAKIKTAKSALIWGIVGVAVGILAYSVVYIIQNILLYGN